MNFVRSHKHICAWSAWMVQPTWVDIYRGSVYWIQQASWTKLYNFRKIGVVCVRIFENKLFYQCFLCLLFLKHFLGEISIYLSDHLVLVCTPAKCPPNIRSKYMPKRSLKQTLQYVYCMNPTSSWNRGFVRGVGWGLRFHVIFFDWHLTVTCFIQGLSFTTFKEILQF